MHQLVLNQLYDQMSSVSLCFVATPFDLTIDGGLGFVNGMELSLCGLFSELRIIVTFPDNMYHVPSWIRLNHLLRVDQCIIPICLDRSSCDSHYT